MQVAEKSWVVPVDKQPTKHVDTEGVTWYRIICKHGLEQWIEAHGNKLHKVQFHPTQVQYWVHEKLFGLILMKGV